MYLPLAALTVAIVLAAWMAAERLLRRRTAIGMAALLVLCAAAGLGALTFQRNMQYRSEISIWEDTTRKRPENVRAWSALGRAYDNASRYNDAIRACDRALAVDMGANLFDTATAHCNRGIACAATGRLSEAVQDYDMAIVLNPDYALAFNNRGLARAALGRLAEAIGDYGQAIELNPDYAEAYVNRGIAYAWTGRSDEAIRDFDQALSLDPEYALGYYNRGLACAESGRLDDAIRDYDAAIALRPDYAEMYESRGVAYARSARLAEGLRDLDRAVEMKPNDAQARNIRGAALAGAGRFDEAIHDYDAAIKLNPDFAQAYLSRGAAYEESGRPAEAIRDFSQAIALNPAFAEAYYDRGNALADANRHVEAVRDYEKAIALQPNFAAAYNNRAIAYYAMKAYDKARADVKMFVRLGGRPDPGFLKALEQAPGAARVNPTMSHRTKTILAVAVIVIAVAAAYSNSFSGPFIFDDFTAIQRNATIRSLRSARSPGPAGQRHPGAPAAGEPVLRGQLRHRQARRALVPCRESADPSAGGADALRHRPPNAAAAGAARPVRRRLDRPGGGRGADLGAASAADRIGDVSRPARRVAHGPLLPAHAVRSGPRRVERTAVAVVRGRRRRLRAGNGREGSHSHRADRRAAV